MSSPVRQQPEVECHTPRRLRIQTLKDDAGFSFRQIQEKTGIPKSTVLDLYHNRRGRQHLSSNPAVKRGRPSKLSPKDIRSIEAILESHEFESRALTWEQLGYEANLDVAGRTIKRAMGTMSYYKCVSPAGRAGSIAT